ncbi:hypothetical protein EDB83DRAFT_2317250 [Lactarius deliciosus]|nr:hypothetical protein EDB83DRAFT_2317250 [Lactarius deliciosus]
MGMGDMGMGEGNMGMGEGNMGRGIWGMARMGEEKYEKGDMGMGEGNVGRGDMGIGEGRGEREYEDGGGGYGKGGYRDSITWSPKGHKDNSGRQGSSANASEDRDSSVEASQMGIMRQRQCGITQEVKSTGTGPRELTKEDYAYGTSHGTTHVSEGISRFWKSRHGVLEWSYGGCKLVTRKCIRPDCIVKVQQRRNERTEKGEGGKIITIGEGEGNMGRGDTRMGRGEGNYRKGRYRDGGSEHGEGERVMGGGANMEKGNMGMGEGNVMMGDMGRRMGNMGNIGMGEGNLRMGMGNGGYEDEDRGMRGWGGEYGDRGKHVT